jgi:hypothetical protein
MNKRKVDDSRQRERERGIKHRGSYHTFFPFKGDSLEKARSQLAKFFWIKN